MEHAYRLFFLVLLLVVNSNSISFATNFGKKTVCSITINSDDEIETYRRYLSSKDFNFTELVTSDRDWLKKACQSGIECDVIIMSGHFGGSFFGTKGFLSLDEMEAASCDRRCDGIFHNATEVYMYGCNTLAGKNKDHRTPQEYISVLREDGYSLSEAQQIAAFLYSPFGAAFYSRMSKVFSRVPRIYGFDGKAPLGYAVRPILSTYLKKMAPQFYNYLNDESTNKNTLYSSAMAGTNSTQIAGDFTNTEYPACYINNQLHSTTEKIVWIRDHILAEYPDNKFDSIPMAQHFFRELRKNGYLFSTYENSILEELRSNVSLKKAIAALKLKLKVMPSVSYQLSDFEHWMEWLSDEAFYEIEIKTLLGDDRRTYTAGLRDFVCSLDRPINVRLEQIPPHFLNQGDFMWALSCVKPVDERLIEKLSEYLTFGDKNVGLIEIARFLGKARPQNPKVHWNLYQAFKHQDKETTKWFMIHALGSIPATDPEILDKLADDLLVTRSSSLATVLAEAIAKGQTKNPDTQLKVIKAFVFNLTHPEEFGSEFSDKNYLANSLSYAINVLRPTDSKVKNVIVSILKTYTLTQQQRSNLKLAIGTY